MGRRSLRRAVTLTVVLLVSSAACSTSAGESSTPQQSQTQSTERSESSVAPAAIPTQWRTVDGPDFTIGVPDSFEERTFTASNGTTAHAFDAPDSTEDALERVAIVRDEDPKTDVIEQSIVLEEMQSVGNEGEVARAEVDWPGAQKAVLVQWTSPVAGTQGERRETWQLMAQISPELILNVVALGDAASFADSELPRILTTFSGR